MVAITTAILSLNGCGDANSTPETPSSISTEDTNNTFTTNLGQPLNSLGYYGDNVWFGDIKVVGTWGVYYTPDGTTKAVLKSDGSTLGISEDGVIASAYEDNIYLYGVSEDGNKLTINHPSGGTDIYTYISQSEWGMNCFITELYGHYPGFEPEIRNNHLICKILDDNTE